MSENGSGPGQGTSVGYEITDAHCVSRTGKPTKGKIPKGRLVRRWKDELDDYWKGIIWQRIAQDRQMWKQHAEALAQLRNTMIA